MSPERMPLFDVAGLRKYDYRKMSRAGVFFFAFLREAEADGLFLFAVA